MTVVIFETFHATGVILYALQTSENQRFSDIFSGHSERPVIETILNF